MANINDSKNWGFETRQLHIGQEQADPATFQSTLQHLTYSMIHSMQQTDLDFVMQETFTEDLLSLQRIFLNRESHLWKAELQHWQ